MDRLSQPLVDDSKKASKICRSGADIHALVTKLHCG